MSAEPTVLLMTRCAALSLAAESCLRDLGCRVVFSSDGHRALLALTSERPELVLLDLDLLLGDGLTFLQVLRQMTPLRDVPVVGIDPTSPLGPPLPERLADLGVATTVSRSVPVDEVLAALREAGLEP